MDDILSLINTLPFVISNIIYGCLFLSIFNFTTFKDSKTNNQHYFIFCITINFILKAIIDSILKLTLTSLSNDSVEYYLICLLFTVITAFISGKIVSAKFFNSLLLKMGIQRTTNKNIWSDVLKNNTWLYIYLKDKDLGYIGYHKYSEENCSNPKIVLSHYQLRELSTGKVLVDYSRDKNSLIMIDTRDVEIIEIIYDDNENDSIKDKIKNLFRRNHGKIVIDEENVSE